jgi:pimeloyl-ACP methyl ester carboxylesterase
MVEYQPSQIARVNGVGLAYVTQGPGDNVIFVHGRVNDLRSWSRQVPVFAGLFHAVSYSRRFHWPNTPPEEDARYAARQHAADLAALIETLDLAPAHLIGSSYGALTALACAEEHPELVRSLVLGEPPLLTWLSQSPEGPALLDSFMTSAFQPAGAAFAGDDPEEGVRRFINGVIGPSVFDHLPPAGRAAMLDNAPAMRAETQTPPEVYFPALSPDDVARMTTPVLLVEGEISPRMFGVVTDMLARVLPGAERATIPAASHGMHAQNPDVYNETVLDFLRRH